MCTSWEGLLPKTVKAERHKHGEGEDTGALFPSLLSSLPQPVTAQGVSETLLCKGREVGPRSVTSLTPAWEELTGRELFFLPALQKSVQEILVSNE